MVVVYENGVFLHAATRGDGLVGEDVQCQYPHHQSHPSALEVGCARLEGAREVYMPKREFARINQEKEEKGERVFANPRNAAAGSIRQLNPQVTASRFLSAFFYDVIYAEGVALTSQQEMLDFMHETRPAGQSK